jgi:hypothetical protein
LAGGEFQRPGAAFFNNADNLVAQNKGKGRRGCAAFYFIEFGVADTADGNFHQNLPFARFWFGNLHKRKRPRMIPNIRYSLQYGRFHGFTPSGIPCFTAGHVRFPPRNTAGNDRATFRSWKPFPAIDTAGKKQILLLLAFE